MRFILKVTQSAFLAIVFVLLASSAQAQSCNTAADCNDNDVCTNDNCIIIDVPSGAPRNIGNFCEYTSPNPVPTECSGCCDTCGRPTAGTERGKENCCQAFDQFTCNQVEGQFTAGGQCNIEIDQCELPQAFECPSAPVASASCRQMTKPNRHRLTINDWTGKYDRKDRLEWGWRRGESTTLADYGNPATTTSYGLCLYDGNENLIFGASVPPGPLWQTLKTSFVYTNKKLDEDGIRRISLRSRSGVPGKAQIRVVGAGRLMTLGNATPGGNLPDLGGFAIAAAPNAIRMQMINSDGVCWEAHYQTRIRKNQVVNARVSRLRAKND